MKDIKIGLQIHSVREDFAEDPVGTLKRVAEMGYDGVELNFWALKKEASFYKELLAENGLNCFGCLTAWKDVQPENLEHTIRYIKELGTNVVAIGSVDPGLLKSDPDYPWKALECMQHAHKLLKEEGMVSGYHNHDSDSNTYVEGKTFLEWLFDKMPEDFIMLLDTGNAQAANADSLELLRTYPGRTQIAHIKGYSEELDYTTPIWKSEIDLKNFVKTAIQEGGMHTMNVEFGKRGDYEPFERAQKSLLWLREQVEALETL